MIRPRKEKQAKAPWTSFAKIRGKSPRQVRDALDREYERRKRIWMAYPCNLRCAVCIIRYANGDLKWEKVKLTEDLHHSRGRGKYYLAEDTWIPVCRAHHNWIHNNPAAAGKEGWLKPPLIKA